MKAEKFKKKYDNLIKAKLIDGKWTEYIELYDVYKIIVNEIKENNDIHSVMRSNKLKPDEEIIDKEYLKELEDFYNSYA